MSARCKRKLKELSSEVAKLHRQAVPPANPQDDPERVRCREAIGRWIDTGDANELPEALREYAPILEQFMQELPAESRRYGPQTSRIEALVKLLDASTPQPPDAPAPPAAAPASPPAAEERLPTLEPPAATKPAPPPAQTPQRLIPRLW